jgi:hypothetical protein
MYTVACGKNKLYDAFVNKGLGDGQYNVPLLYFVVYITLRQI